MELVVHAGNRTLPPVLDLPLHLYSEDDHIAVVGKPPGIAVSGNTARTVERALRGNVRVSPQVDALPWPRPVHRLDAPTGGLLLVAKTATAMVSLGRQFQQRRVQKRYLALVTGRLDGDGTVRSPVEGRPAETAYRALSHTRSLRTEWLTTVEARPATGRTHQIRRHLAELGHPVVGDRQYGAEGSVLRSKGLFLWAVELRFEHPVTGATVVVSTDPPPKFSTYPEREERRWHRVRETETRWRGHDAP
jgi:tRNA pseudouridine65 synthase/23S rRNA pseudouridine1911/1915/1917 synthase